MNIRKSLIFLIKSGFFDSYDTTVFLLQYLVFPLDENAKPAIIGIVAFTDFC